MWNLDEFATINLFNLKMFDNHLLWCVCVFCWLFFGVNDMCMYLIFMWAGDRWEYGTKYFCKELGFTPLIYLHKSWILVFLFFSFFWYLLTWFLKCKFSPWDEAPYKDAVDRTPLRGLSLSGFLSQVGMPGCSSWHDVSIVCFLLMNQ